MYFVYKVGFAFHAIAVLFCDFRTVAVSTRNSRSTLESNYSSRQAVDPNRIRYNHDDDRSDTTRDTVQEPMLDFAGQDENLLNKVGLVVNTCKDSFDKGKCIKQLFEREGTLDDFLMNIRNLLAFENMDAFPTDAHSEENIEKPDELALQLEGAVESNKHSQLEEAIDENAPVRRKRSPRNLGIINLSELQKIIMELQQIHFNEDSDVLDFLNIHRRVFEKLFQQPAHYQALLLQRLLTSLIQQKIKESLAPKRDMSQFRAWGGRKRSLDQTTVRDAAEMKSDVSSHLVNGGEHDFLEQAETVNEDFGAQTGDLKRSDASTAAMSLPSFFPIYPWNLKYSRRSSFAPWGGKRHVFRARKFSPFVRGRYVPSLLFSNRIGRRNTPTANQNYSRVLTGNSIKRQHFAAWGGKRTNDVEPDVMQKCSSDNDKNDGTKALFDTFDKELDVNDGKNTLLEELISHSDQSEGVIDNVYCLLRPEATNCKFAPNKRSGFKPWGGKRSSDLTKNVLPAVNVEYDVFYPRETKDM